MTAKNNHTELIDQLTEGIANLTSSENWQHYLDFQSRFHRYSFGNVLLIAAQCHEATRVAGFNAWRKMNRFVRKGEKAIWILAPMVYKNADAEDGENDRVIRGFKFVGVFDVAQTDGEELPSICNRIDGDDPAGLYAQLVTVAESIGFSVEDHEFGGSTNGDCTYDLHRIRVEAHNTPAQRVKTLAHEITHASSTRVTTTGRWPSSRPSPRRTWSARRSGSTRATTPSGTSQPGPVATTRRRRPSGSPESRIQRAADTILTALGGEELAEVA